MDDYKLGTDEKEAVLQSQIERSFNIQIQQTSLPKPSPLLEFNRQKDKEKGKEDSMEQKQKTAEKDILLDNHNKENTTTNGISSIKKETTLQYNPLNTDDNLIDYYRKSSQPLIQLFLDSLKLQKDYINVFQPQWVEYTRTMVENYLVFVDKMIFLYIQNYNAILYSVFDNIKLKGKEKEKDGEKEQKGEGKGRKEQQQQKDGEVRGIEKTTTKHIYHRF